MENTQAKVITNLEEEKNRKEKARIELIKRTVAKGATADELKMFLYQSNRTGLDPLARQIYFVKRNSKNGPVVTIQTSIDGFRVIAERSGMYAGQDEPEFLEGDNHPIKCVVRVYKFTTRGDRYCASVGVAYWDEYKPEKGDAMWNKMPHTMLAKVAEALALRKAFPQDLSGLYTGEEMEQSEPLNVQPIKEEVEETKLLDHLPSADFVQETANPSIQYDEMDDFGAINAKKETNEISKEEAISWIEEKFGNNTAIDKAEK